MMRRWEWTRTATLKILWCSWTRPWLGVRALQARCTSGEGFITLPENMSKETMRGITDGMMSYLLLLSENGSSSSPGIVKCQSIRFVIYI